MKRRARRGRRKMDQSANRPDGQDCPDLPVAVIEEIILNLPADQALRVCRLVCREWKVVVDSASFWREKCRREGLKPRCITTELWDWKTFYFLFKEARNLLKNPSADESFSGWEIIQNGGDGWTIERIFAPHPDNTVTKCFVTSYHSCLKCQLIDLEKEGYSPAFLDEMQPDIVISDWYAPRRDCGSKYDICVELLNQNQEAIQTFQPESVFFPQWNDQQWKEMKHVFKNYGRGVRFIRFTHGGQDTKCWAGYYGIRVTSSSVKVCLTAG
ncbi:F-box only protein 44-like [Colossoma macropomum]|uniref:F-box only protein 44-like n=1 Tax=Colossoma macropomum TaxID=42526 RepID=UPI001863B9B5|nr:F-box only protein 44-like [Colossoma macropomum]